MRPPRSPRRVLCVVDVVLIAPLARGLGVLLRRESSAGRGRWEVPWAPQESRESLSEAAVRIGRSARGATPPWLHQIGAVGEDRRHPAGPCLSIGYVGASIREPDASGAEGSTSWFPVDQLPVLASRHRATIRAALELLRARLDDEPIAFRLLDTTFTLGDLQHVYELLLGRRLHKASFRRALHAARVVEATHSWRGEGRGRPAQLFRFAPRKRRAAARAPRFDRLA
jgi:hypothetical protein